jgi:two-component system KDP operon response regulator KdpE
VNHRLLIIDDDLGLLALLRQWLELEGFSVVTAKNGMAGLREAERVPPDLILLDIMMPRMDGWSTYRQLRAICDAPIIVLTAMATKEDIAKAVSLGVDDFLTKPCSFDELRTRIGRALGERSSGAHDRFVLFDDGHLRVDLMQGASLAGHESVHLTPTESRLLLYLARRKGQTVPHKELLVNVWGPEYEEELRYLELYVRHLSHKIENDPRNPRYILNDQERGYCFADMAAPAVAR